MSEIMPDKRFTEVVDGQQVVRTLAQSGTIIPEPSKDPAKYFTALVQTSDGVQQVVKTYEIGGGGGGGGDATWGSITGTLSNQTDLQTALDEKVSKTGDTMTGVLVIRRESGNEFLQIEPNAYLAVAPTNTRNIAMFVTYDNSRRAMAKCLQVFGKDGSNAIKMAVWQCNPTRNIVTGLEAGWDANGIAYAMCPQTTDSRNNPQDIITRSYLDAYKTQVQTDLSAKANATVVETLTTDSVELASNKIYNGGELASVTLTAPANVPADFIAQVEFTSGATATTFTAPASLYFNGDACEGGIFTPIANKRYCALIITDGVNLLGFVVEK